MTEVVTQSKPFAIRIAASALISATIEPTARSIPAVMMTKVMATATISTGAP